jgi:histone-lysine N-methyltransferase SETMAR
MLAVFWNPDGFHVVPIWPASHSFTAPWFIDQNLQPLIDKFFQNGRRPSSRKLVVHVDNAAPYNANMAQNFFGHSPPKTLPHPPYSPDISPSYFYRFGKIKTQLIGHEIPDEISLFEAVSEILSAISPAELRRVF